MEARANLAGLAGGRRVERHIFYLGEVNDSQREGWLKLIQAFDIGTQQHTKLALFAGDRPVPMHAADLAVQVRLAEFSIHRPRQWGACWVFLQLWAQSKLEEFWWERLAASREHTSEKAGVKTVDSPSALAGARFVTGINENVIYRPMEFVALVLSLPGRTRGPCETMSISRGRSPSRVWVGISRCLPMGVTL